MRIDTETLDAYRAEEGLATRQALARRMGVSNSTVTRIYAGNQPGHAIVNGLLRAFPDKPLPIIPD